MQYDTCRRFGIHVVEVDGLDDEVVYVEGHSVALVRAGLDPDVQAWASGWILSEALSDRIAL